MESRTRIDWDRVINVATEELLGRFAADFMYTNPKLRGEEVKMIHQAIATQCDKLKSGWDRLQCIVNAMQRAYSKVKEEGKKPEEVVQYIYNTPPEQLKEGIIIQR